MAKFWRPPLEGMFGIPDDVIQQVSAAIARGHCVLPFASDSAGLSLYVPAEHPNLELLQSRLKMLLKQPVNFSPLPHAVIEGCLDMYYPESGDDVSQIRDCTEQFRFFCPRIWDSLDPTDKPDERHCPECNETVYRCSDSEELESLRGKRKCVALGTVLGGI